MRAAVWPRTIVSPVTVPPGATESAAIAPDAGSAAQANTTASLAPHRIEEIPIYPPHPAVKVPKCGTLVCRMTLAREFWRQQPAVCNRGEVGLARFDPLC